VTIAQAIALIRAAADRYEKRHKRLQATPEGTINRCCNRVVSLALDAVATEIENG